MVSLEEVLAGQTRRYLAVSHIEKDPLASLVHITHLGLRFYTHENFYKDAEEFNLQDGVQFGDMLVVPVIGSNEDVLRKSNAEFTIGNRLSIRFISQSISPPKGPTRDMLTQEIDTAFERCWRKVLKDSAELLVKRYNKEA